MQSFLYERILPDLLFGVVLDVRQAFPNKSGSFGVNQRVTANSLADRAKLAGAYALLIEVDELVRDPALLEKALGLSRIAGFARAEDLEGHVGSITHESVRIEPEERHDSAVILMHGLGADGHDFESLVPELRLPPVPCIRWIFPHAPIRPVTINGGDNMRAWFDITAIDSRAAEDDSGIRESAAAIGALVRAEQDKGIAADRIILAGFSQGGAMALFTALRWPERLAGVAALSCWLPDAGSLHAEVHRANSAAAVFMAHGTMDPLVPLRLAEDSRDVLRANGCTVTWLTYPMAHNVCAAEVADLREWLLGALPVPSS